jgi:hypothetical protein
MGEPRRGTAMPEATKPYNVEWECDGCSFCHHGRMYTVVGPDDVAIGQSFGDEEDAGDIAGYMNQAHEGGCKDYISRLPADWFEDSSLEKWFPLTAEELTRVKRERDELLNALKAVLPFVEDERDTRERSYLSEPTKDEETYLTEASSAVECIKSAIAMVEGR